MDERGERGGEGIMPHSFITIKKSGQYPHYSELGSRFLREGQQLTVQWMVNDRQDYVCLAERDGDGKVIHAKVLVQGLHSD